MRPGSGCSARLKGAQAELLAANWNRKAVITTLVSDVATAYFGLLEQDMGLGIAKSTLATREESLRLIRIQQQGGAATVLDIRQAEQYGAAQSVPSTEQQIEQTENQISLLPGKNPGPVTRGRLLTEQPTPPEVAAGLPSSLLERRSDVQAAEQILVSANANIGVARQPVFRRLRSPANSGFRAYLTAQLGFCALAQDAVV